MRGGIGYWVTELLQAANLWQLFQTKLQRANQGPGAAEIVLPFLTVGDKSCLLISWAAQAGPTTIFNVRKLKFIDAKFKVKISRAAQPSPLEGAEKHNLRRRFMVLMDGSAGYQQPCYSSYINLRNMGHSSNNNNNHNDNAVSCVLPSSEEFGYKSVLQRRNRTLVFGCRHFPAVEVQTKANWSCEFCHGAKLIEQASRSNEAVSSLDIDKLLVSYTDPGNRHKKVELGLQVPVWLCLAFTRARFHPFYRQNSARLHQKKPWWISC